MRWSCLLAVVLVLSVPGLADDGPSGGAVGTGDETALKRAEELDGRIVDLFREGKYGEAIPLAREAVRLREEALGPDHADVAESLDNLGVILKRAGRYEDARPIYERALRIKETALGPLHPDLARCLNNLGQLLKAQGAYEEAVPLYERALRIAEKSQGPLHTDVAIVLNNLAVLLQAQGASEEARPLFERALEIKEAALGPEHRSVGVGLANLALLLQAQGAYEEAMPLHRRALEILEKACGPEHPSVAGELHNLARLLLSLRAYEEALPLYERALRIKEKSLGPDHPHVAASVNDLALLLKVRKEWEAARPLYERALKIYEKAYGPDHPLVATSLTNLGRLLQAQGALDDALPLYERALEIREAAHGPDHPGVARSLHNLVSLSVAAGRYESAVPLSERCLSILERSLRRRCIGLQASERLAMARSLRGYLDSWVRLAPHVGRSGYAEVLRFKGLVTRLTAAERRLARRGGPDVAPRVLRLRAAERRVSRLAHTIPPSFRKAKHAAWRESFAKESAARDDLAFALARDFAPLREGLERLDLTLGDIQARLRADEVLVDFLQSGDRYYAWIVRHKGAVERLDLGADAMVEQAAGRFSSRTADPVTQIDDERWLAAGMALRDLVWEPVRARLGKGVRTICLCPDAALAAIPFCALPGRESGRFLTDDHLLVQVSMAQDLVPGENDSEQGEGALAVGGVDYRKASASTDRPFEPRPSGIAATDRAPRGSLFSPLPQTGEEVAFLKTRIGEGCGTLVGADATEARFRSEAKGRRLLHLATHGFVLDDILRGLRSRRDAQEWLGAAKERRLALGHDPMNLAGLAMAGANARDGAHGDDGILTALEASHLDLDGVDLVVLSACRTARGRAESGEGVIGLVRGFRMAGAERVVASLWEVDDEATRILMGHLYGGVLRKEKTLTPAEALRAASSLLRAATRAGRHHLAAPRNWAAFVCYGR